MKNKIFGVAFIMVIAVLATINIDLTKSDNGNYNLEMASIEAFADPEYNDWPDWWDHGLTADEREWQRPCPIEEGVSVEVCVEWDGAGVCIRSEWRIVNPPQRNEITCPEGEVNCTPIPC